MTESNSGGKGLFCLIGYSLLPREVRAETQGKSLEAGTESETIEGLACPLCLAQPVFLHILGLPAQVAAPTSGLGPLTSVINEENVTQTCLRTNLKQAFSQPRLCFPDHSIMCQRVALSTCLI